MPEMPKAAPLPDRPPLHLKGGHLAIASPDSIAEATFSIPAVRAIRQARPLSTIVVVANEDTAPLWRAMSEVSLVLEHRRSDSARRIARQLKECGQPFDSAISWEDSAAAQAFAKFGIKDRLGYPTDKLKKHLTDPVIVERKIGPIEHRVQHYLLFVEKLGAQPFQASNFTCPPRPEPTEPTTLALVPGSDFGPAAEWPIERFVSLAQGLSEAFQLIILPDPHNGKPASQLAKALGLEVTQADGGSLLDLIARCHGLIASDGSLPHLASFVGTPSLVFFGPNEADWRRPLGKIHRILRSHVPCKACLLNKCPLDHRCMTTLSVEHALTEARAMFS